MDESQIDRLVEFLTPQAVSTYQQGVQSGFRRAGQACTSIQRLYVHEDVMERFLPLLVDATRALKVGDPHDPKTDIGPMISEATIADPAAKASLFRRMSLLSR